MIDKDGNIVKPQGCNYCCLKNKTIGFTPDGLLRDTNLSEAKMAGLKVVCVQEQPAKDETTSQEPLGGSYGWSRWQRFFVKAGFQENEVGFSYLRRCYAGIRDGRLMITGAEAADGAKKCRQYDTILESFKPQAVILTHAFSDSIQTPAFYRMTLADISKANVLTQRGIRCMIVMGPTVAQHYVPSLGTCNIKEWGGTWLEL